MTKDELFHAFYTDTCLSFQPCGERWQQIKSAWNGLVVPWLAIPRSLKDDPPKEGQRIILFSESGSCSSFTQKREIQWSLYTHWIPFPELPKPDKDEQEAREAYENLYTFSNPIGDKTSFIQGFMAARGRK